MAFPLVILAAGEGRRMQAIKPMVKLLGLTLLERCILNFRNAGIEKFYVVVGYKKEEVEKHVEEIRKKYGIDVETIENEKWKEGNGTSVLSAEKHVKKFFVTMVDHVFDNEMIADFIKNVDENKCSLLVDRDSVADIEEATKVRVRRGKIVDIGKELKEYDGVDTGLFFFTPCIFDGLREALNHGDATLTGGVKKIAEKGMMHAYEKKKGWWIDVDTKENKRKAEKMILDQIPKKEEDGVVSFYLNRKISLRISRFLSNFNISPNHITIISFLIAVFGSFLFIAANYLFTILAGIMLQIASIIDGCDGEIARLKYLSTPSGAWMDTLLDRYADSIMVIFITYNGWIFYKIAWILGIISIIAFIMASYSRKEYELRYGKKLSSKMDKISKRDIRIFSIFIGSLFNRPFEFMVAIAILHHISIIWGFIEGRK